MTYKLFINLRGDKLFIKLNADGSSLSFHPYQDNTDYANFKSQINADEAQLQDADGNTMSAEEAKAFVATLP